MSELDQLQVQMGRETTFGTGVAATAKLMGVLDAKIREIPVVEVVEERRGTLVPGYNAVLKSVSGEGSIEMYASYEESHLIEMLTGPDTPSGAGPYTYDYVAPALVGTADVLPMRSIEYGDKIAGGPNYRGLSMFAGKTTWTIEHGEIAKIEQDWLGQHVEIFATLTTLADRAVEFVRAADFTIAHDTWAGTLGATVLAATLRSAELEVDPQRGLKPYVGSLMPLGGRGRRWTGKLTLGLEFNATSKAIVESIIGNTVQQRQIRLKAVSGTKQYQIDFTGTYTAAPEFWDDEDGLVVAEFEMTPTYHDTVANWLKFQIINNVATIP